MKCVALGQSYEIPFRSRQDYQYAPDVGAAVGHAALDPFEGYGVFTLPGRTAGTTEIVSHLRNASEALGIAGQFKITVGNEAVPFICDLEDEPFRHTFPETPQTPLDQAVRQSLEEFLRQVDRGWLQASSI